MTSPKSCSSGLRSRPSAARRQQALEGVGGDQDEEQEAEGDQAQRAEYAGHHRVRQLVATAWRPPNAHQRQHQHPQQQRTFVPAPDGGDAVLAGAAANWNAARHRPPRNRLITKAWVRQAKEKVISSAMRRRGRAGQRDPGHAGCWCAPSSGSVPRISATSVARMRAKWPSSGIMSVTCLHLVVAGRFAGLVRGAACLGVTDCLGGFRRHVVLVVLGQHFAGGEGAVAGQLALGDDAFAFLEQVGQDALVVRRSCPCRCR